LRGASVSACFSWIAHPQPTKEAILIPVNVPLLDGNERDYVQQCISSGWLSSEGEFVRRFETAMAERLHRKHAIAVANGSAALDVAVAALKLGPGDEVILPTHTIISCASAVVRAGARPVLVDSDPVNWNLDVNAIEAAITPQTRAIMVVHTFGLPVDMARVLALSKRYRLAIIEDAAQAIGQTYDGTPCGSFGDVSCLSFYSNKHVTTGEGGMVLCNDETLAVRARSLRNLCFLPHRRFLHEELGWNYRMSNLQAAVGLAQLENLSAHIARKTQLGKTYQRLLQDVAGLELPQASLPFAENHYWVFGVILKDDVPADADEARALLAERGVDTRPFFWPMHEQPVFLKNGMFQNERYPVAERMSRRGFYLPSGLALTLEQQEKTVEAVQAMMECIL
jgi:perosamine synthetase